MSGSNIRMGIGVDDLAPQVNFLGIDAGCADPRASVHTLMSEHIYRHRMFAEKPPTQHPIFGRQPVPVSCTAPWSYSGVCVHLCTSFANRTRTCYLALKFHPSGERLLATTQGGEVGVWSGANLQFEDLKRVTSGKGAATTLAFSHVKDRVYVGDSSGQVAVLSHSLSPIENDALQGLTRPVLDLSCSPMSSLVGGCAEFSGSCIWDGSRLCLLRRLESQSVETGSCCCLQFHPYSSLVATATKTGWVTFWDLRSREPASSFQAHRVAANKALFHPSGDIFISCGKDCLIRSTDLRTLRPIHTFRVEPCASSSSVGSARRSIATTGENLGSTYSTIEPTQICIHPTQPHLLAVGDIQGGLSYFSLLHAGSKLIRVDIALNEGGSATNGSGAATQMNQRECAVLAMDFHPSGNSLVTASEGRWLRLWGRGVPGGIIGRNLDLRGLEDVDENVPGFPISARRPKDRPITFEQMSVSVTTVSPVMQNKDASEGTSLVSSNMHSGVVPAPEATNDGTGWMCGLPTIDRSLLIQPERAAHIDIEEKVVPTLSHSGCSEST